MTTTAAFVLLFIWTNGKLGGSGTAYFTSDTNCLAARDAIIVKMGSAIDMAQCFPY